MKTGATLDLKKIFYAFSIRIIGAGASFLSAAYVARCLGAEDAGYFFLASSFAIGAATFARLGLDKTVLRFSSICAAERNWAGVWGVYIRAMVLVVPLSMILTAAVLMAGDFFSVSVFEKEKLLYPIYFSAFAIPFINLYFLSASILQSLHRFNLAVFLLNVMVNLAVFMAAFFCFYADINSSPDFFSKFFASACFFAAITGFLVVFRVVPCSSPDYRGVQLEKSCMPMYVVDVMNMLIQVGPLLIAGTMISSESVAHLTAAQRLSGLIGFFLLSFNVVSAPYFAAWYKNNEHKKIEKVAKSVTALSLLLSIPAVLLFCVFPEFFMSLFGGGFSGAADLLCVMAVGQLVNAFSGPVTYLLAMSGHDRDVRNLMLVSGALSVVLPFFLVPSFGVLGAAYSYVVSFAVQNFLGVLYVKKNLGFWTSGYLLFFLGRAAS